MDKKAFKLYDQMVSISLVIERALKIGEPEEIAHLMNAQKLLLESMLISNHMAQKECKCEEK